MKKLILSEEQIIAVLRQVEMGAKVLDVCGRHGIADATFYNWKARYGSLDVWQLRRLKELEGGNAKLKKMCAKLAMLHHALQDCHDPAVSAQIRLPMQRLPPGSLC
jgi:putative transposase